MLNVSALENSSGKKTFDSDFLGSLVTLAQKVQENGSVLGIWNAGREFSKMAGTMKLDMRLNILPGRKIAGNFPTETSAIEKLRELAGPSRGNAVEVLVAAAAATAATSVAQV